MDDVVGDGVAVSEGRVPVEQAGRGSEIAEPEVARLRGQHVELGEDAVGDGGQVLHATGIDNDL